MKKLPFRGAYAGYKCRLLRGSESADLGGSGHGIGAHELNVRGLDGQTCMHGLAGELDDLAAFGHSVNAHVGIDFLFRHSAGDDVGVVVVLAAQGVQRSSSIVDALPAAVGSLTVGR